MNLQKKINRKNLFVLFFLIFALSFLSSLIFFVKKPKNTNQLKIAHISPEKIKSLVDINNEEDVFKKRERLINYIWKNNSIPSTEPEEIERNISDKKYKNLKNLKSIDRLIIKMEFGVESRAYHFNPEKRTNELIVYHQGHRGDFFQGYDTIEAFLTLGFDVIALAMPLLTPNNQPTVEIPGSGIIKLDNHNKLKLLDNPEFSSIHYFLEPVIKTINYAEKLKFDKINMVGISGGGWTTVLAPAIDQRIAKSYSVSGSYPIYLREPGSNSWGDYEQTEANLYKIASYLELYVLASFGSNRKHTQIVNFYDPCCFGGEGYKSYEKIVSQKMTDLNKGVFSIQIDASHKKHEISEQTINFIMNDIKIKL